MTVENLAEINLYETRRTSTHDLNWITYHGDNTDPSWMHAYWKAETCLGHAPIWETLVEGHINILGTQLREKAYQMIKEQFPESMCWLEIARIAAWAGSDLGSIAAFILSKGDNFAMDYYFNVEDANNPTVLKKVEDHKQSGLPGNWKDIEPSFSKGTFGSVPDLRKFSLVEPKTEMPYLGELL